MKSYEIIARKAEDYSKQRWSVREKSSLTTGIDITQKDSFVIGGQTALARVRARRIKAPGHGHAIVVGN